jgi:hypothetical protein
MRRKTGRRILPVQADVRGRCEYNGLSIHGTGVIIEWLALLTEAGLMLSLPDVWQPEQEGESRG